MKDKKFVIAVSVIVLLGVALLYITVVSPKIQGYVIDKQTQAQENTVNAILQIVDQQGYVAIGDGENSVVLIKYQPPQDQQVQQQAQQNPVEELADETIS